MRSNPLGPPIWHLVGTYLARICPIADPKGKTLHRDILPDFTFLGQRLACFWLLKTATCAFLLRANVAESR